MAGSYSSAIRNGTLEAARLHQRFGSRVVMEKHGGAVDVFDQIANLQVPLLLRPLSGLLGAFLPEPTPGILVTTERPFNIQRFTAAHELGHYYLKHKPSLDDEKGMLRRMALPGAATDPSPNFQEVEADAFASSLLMPDWLIHWHCRQQGWLAKDFSQPLNVYQLALRLGASYEATTWTLERQKLISPSTGVALRCIKPRNIKAELLGDYKPSDYRGDVWLLTERDSGTKIDGSRIDHFVFRVNEHRNGGYLWDIDQLRESGFVIVSDERNAHDDAGIGSPVIRRVIGDIEQAAKGHLRLAERRPWQATTPLSQYDLDFDFTGPEEVGLSRAERRQLLGAL